MTSFEKSEKIAHEFESDYIVDDNEAREIDSCLNFLSILDEETSNDCSGVTLFRKKDDAGNNCETKTESLVDRGGYESSISFEGILSSEKVYSSNLETSKENFIDAHFQVLTSHNTNNFSEENSSDMSSTGNVFKSNSSVEVKDADILECVVTTSQKLEPTYLDLAKSERKFINPEILKINSTEKQNERPSIVKFCSNSVKAPQSLSPKKSSTLKCPELNLHSKEIHVNKLDSELFENQPNTSVSFSEWKKAYKSNPINVLKERISENPLTSFRLIKNCSKTNKKIYIRNMTSNAYYSKFYSNLPPNLEGKKVIKLLQKNTRNNQDKAVIVAKMNDSELNKDINDEHKAESALHVPLTCNKLGEASNINPENTTFLTLDTSNLAKIQNKSIDIVSKKKIPNSKMSKKDGCALNHAYTTPAEISSENTNFIELEDKINCPKSLDSLFFNDSDKKSSINNTHPPKIIMQSPELIRLDTSDGCQNSQGMIISNSDERLASRSKESNLNVADLCSEETPLFNDSSNVSNNVERFDCIINSVTKIKTRPVPKIKMKQKSKGLKKKSKKSKTPLKDNEKNGNEMQQKYAPLMRTGLPSFMNYSEITEKKDKSTLLSKQKTKIKCTKNIKGKIEVPIEGQKVSSSTPDIYGGPNAVPEISSSFDNYQELYSVVNEIPANLPVEVFEETSASSEGKVDLKRDLNSEQNEVEYVGEKGASYSSRVLGNIIGGSGRMNAYSSVEILLNPIEKNKRIDGEANEEPCNHETMKPSRDLDLMSKRTTTSEPDKNDEKMEAEYSKQDTSHKEILDETQCKESQKSEKNDKGSSNKFSEKIPSPTYSYNKSSPLSFCAQNILENMFKYESFPSSTNMARVAKLLEVSWKDVRDWFVGRRSLNKKNGIFLRNQSLTFCNFCPDFKPLPNEQAVVHLLNKNHIDKMMSHMKKHNLIFSKLQGINNDLDGSKKLSAGDVDDVDDVEPVKPGVQPSALSDSDVQCSRDGSSDSGKEGVIEKNSPSGEKPKPSSPSKNDKSFRKPELTKKPLAASASPGKTKLSSSHTVKDEMKILIGLREKDRLQSEICIGYRCPDCLKIFQTEWMLMKHSVSHKLLICSECGLTFTKEDQLKAHFLDHMIQSIDDDEYLSYVCLRCNNLRCVCFEGNYYIPSSQTKHYIRPQKSKRSKPFTTTPYSGANEHLKVTVQEFWNQFSNSKSATNDGSTSTNQKSNSRLSSMKSNKTPRDPSVSSPTYTNITTYNCNFCEFFFFTQDELKEHLIVHRIQARNRGSKRSENLPPNNTKIPKSEPNASAFKCYYCKRSHKTETELRKHLRVECKNLPKKIEEIIFEGDFKIQNFEKTNNYRVELRHGIEEPTVPSTFKCELCHIDHPEDERECHERVCSVVNNTWSDDSFRATKKSGDCYYLCTFCDSPLISEKLLRSHLISGCENTPSQLKSELRVHSKIRRLLGNGVHYRLIDKEALLEELPQSKILSILDFSTFVAIKSDEKRVKCKFCEKYPYVSCLKLHLFKQCKNLPHQFKDVMREHSNYTKCNQPVQQPKIKKSVSTLKRKTNYKYKSKVKMRKSVKSLVVKGKSESCENKIENEDSVSGVDDDILNNEREATSPNAYLKNKRLSNETSKTMVYDCHLCEEQFKETKNFINHMNQSHVLKIPEESAYKWLYPEKSDHSESSSEAEALKVNENCDLKSPNEKNLASSLNRHADEKSIDRESWMDGIADVCLVQDYRPRSSPSKNETRDLEKGGSLSETPTKSQKIDGEDELLGDLDNLDGFIETVQLDDVSLIKNTSL